VPKKIQEATTSLKLIQKYALVGAFTPVLDESIVPVVLLDDLTEVEEWKHAFAFDARAAPGVGNFLTWALENDPDTGKVLELLRITFTATAGAISACVVNPVQPALTTTLTPIFQDMRGSFGAPPTFPSGRPRFEILGALLGGTTVWRIIGLGSTPAIFEPSELLVYPGTRILFQRQTANIDGHISFLWRERNLRPDGS
jgi:hypothetical protein